jgi:hypothetical protein
VESFRFASRLRFKCQILCAVVAGVIFCLVPSLDAFLPRNALAADTLYLIYHLLTDDVVASKVLLFRQADTGEV